MADESELGGSPARFLHTEIQLASTRQTTLQRSVTTVGVGLHTGAQVHLRLSPAPAYTGILFRRMDLDGFEVPAAPQFVAHTNYATTLVRRGVLVGTVEHLLAAFYGCGVDNAVVELDGLEVPILDGSAAGFVQLIQMAGLIELDAPRQFLRVLKTVEIVEGQRAISMSPANTFSIECAIDFDHPLIGHQCRAFSVTRDVFMREIAPARTFGFLQEVESLRRKGLIRGGSLDNAIVLTPEGLLNEDGLRFPDEFVRHKILDLLGDVALLGRPVLGHVRAVRSGHRLHNALVAALLRDPQAWEIVEASERESVACQ